MARVHVRRGTEGPRHDPYSFVEITFSFTNRRRRDVVYHGGLVSWVQHGRRRREEHGQRWDRKTGSWVSKKPAPEEVFLRLTGLDVRRAEAIPDVLLARALRRMSREDRELVVMCMGADAAMLANAY